MNMLFATIPVPAPQLIHFTIKMLQVPHRIITPKVISFLRPGKHCAQVLY